MRAHTRSFLLSCALAFAPLAQAQDFFWDFEGANGFDGWHMYDGSPMQTGPGAASATSVRLQSGPPLNSGSFDSAMFFYHVVPYDPNVFYNITVGCMTLDPDVYPMVYLGWLDTLTQPAFLTAANTSMTVSMGPSSWAIAELLDEYPITGTGAYCIIISASSLIPGEALFDNISVEMIPQGSAMLRAPRLFLGGNFDSGINRMGHHLNDLGLVPATEPYTAMGYQQIGGGGEMCTPFVMEPSFNFNAVDWVRLELRSALDPTVVVATRQLMLTSLGLTCGPNGQLNLHFDLPAGNYYVAVRHRNHLGAMTATPVALPSPFPWWAVDFRSPSLATWGSNARKAVGANMVLWEGDVTGDHLLKYVGMNNDRDPILVAIGALPIATLTGQYRKEDVTMDGVVKYVGVNNDRDPILVNIGGNTPNAVRVEQVP